MSIQALRDSLARARKIGLRIATGVTPDELEMALAEVDKLKARLVDEREHSAWLQSERNKAVDAMEAANARAEQAENENAKLRAALDAHRRFHSKVGCPGGEDCYVCLAEGHTQEAALKGSQGENGQT